jgi:hypothetical protein
MTVIIKSNNIVKFRSQREFYMIIFLNKLKILENTQKMKKIKIKHLWPMIWDPSEIHRSLLGSPGPGDVPAEPPSHRACVYALTFDKINH